MCTLAPITGAGQFNIKYEYRRSVYHRLWAFATLLSTQPNQDFKIYQRPRRTRKSTSPLPRYRKKLELTVAQRTRRSKSHYDGAVPQIRDINDHTQAEVMHTIRILCSVYVEELTETNFSEWQSSINDSIHQSGLDWTVQEQTATQVKLSSIQRTQIMVAVRGLLRKSIPSYIWFEMDDDSMTGTPEKIIANLRSTFTGSNYNVHRRFQMNAQNTTFSIFMKLKDYMTKHKTLRFRRLRSEFPNISKQITIVRM